MCHLSGLSNKDKRQDNPGQHEKVELKPIKVLRLGLLRPRPQRAPLQRVFSAARETPCPTWTLPKVEDHHPPLLSLLPPALTTSTFSLKPPALKPVSHQLEEVSHNKYRNDVFWVQVMRMIPLKNAPKIKIQCSSCCLYPVPMIPPSNRNYLVKMPHFKDGVQASPTNFTKVALLNRSPNKSFLNQWFFHWA